MRTFNCAYTGADGFVDTTESPSEKIVAPSAAAAAKLYAEKNPSNLPRIKITWGLGGIESVGNPALTHAHAARAEREEEQAMQQRLESLYENLKTGEDGNLRDLSYDDLSALVENMRDFPGIRDELSPEEYAVREKLYKVAFFDSNLQAGLQAMPSRHPRFSPQSGKSPQSSSTRSSEFSEAVSYLERIHYWIRFMGIVLLISIILSFVVGMFLGG